MKIQPEGFELRSSRELGIPAAWLFLETPNLVSEWFLDWQTLLVGGYLFAITQQTSMLPTMDMRKMHRSE